MDGRRRKLSAYPRARDFIGPGRRPTEMSTRVRRLLSRVAVPRNEFSRLLRALEFYERQDSGREKVAREAMRRIEARADAIEDWYRELSKLAEQVQRIEEWRVYHSQGR